MSEVGLNTGRDISVFQGMHEEPIVEAGDTRLAALAQQWTEVSTIWYAGGRTDQECMMDELNGRMIACQILITGLIARVANNSPDPLRFLSDFRDEIRAVVKGVNIAGMDNTDRVRQVAQQTVDELFSLMKPPSTD